MNVTNVNNESVTTDSYAMAGDVIKAHVVLTPEVLKNIELSIGAVGFVANISVATVILNKRSMLKSHTNIYILCQSIIDALVALTLILTVLVENDGRYFRGIGDIIYCEVWLSRIPLFGIITSSKYNLVVMTVERYLAIVRPVWHKLHVNRKWVVASVAAAWLFGVAYHFSIKIPSSRVSGGRCLLYQWPSRNVARTVGVTTVAVAYFIPLITFFITYGHIIIKLRMRVNPENASSSMSRARKNVIKTTVMITLAFIVCVTLNQVYFLLFNLGFGLDLKSESYHSSVLMVFINCTIYPFIYLATYQAYQRAVASLLGKITRGRVMWGPKEDLENSAVTQTGKNTTASVVA